MIADFSEQSNSPRNPRKHRRLDDDPPDTGDPCGSSPSLPPSQSAPTDSRPPSYKDKLTGGSRLPIEEEENLDDDEIEILDGDVTTSIVDGIINIDFSDRIRDLAIKSLDQTVVVKLLGRRIGYNTLWGKLYELWKPAQAFRLMDIENDYFLVTFRNHSDYLHALVGGPWTIFGNYLTVESWTENFTPSQSHPRKKTSDPQPNQCDDVPVASPPAPHQPSETEAFGPWMIVARKQRRGPKKTVVVDNSFASAPQVNTCFDPIMDEGVEVQPPEIVEPLRPPRFVTKGKLDAAKPTTASKPSKSVIHVRKPLSISQNVPTSRLSSIASSSFTFPSVPLSSKPIDRGNHYVVNIFENDDPNVVYAPIHQDKGSRSMPPGDPPDVQGLQARTSMVGMDFSQQDGSTLPSKLVIPSESNSDMCLDAAVVTASS
ncbi:hypothetical protein V6N11_025514 [Hibiscus sabdariffa]|uniref:DUF4283 domain-containing protein n=2 Tax=Hibiscus sabdariffa TaxID=183260 RepID=A0ABR2AZ70_9ROSI